MIEQDISMFGEGYRAAKKDALEIIDSLPAEHFSGRIVLKMIRIAIENMDYDPLKNYEEEKE